MSEFLWIRRCSVSFGPRKKDSSLKVVDGLTVRFSISKDVSEKPNTGEITVYNLSKDSRDALAQEKDYVVALRVAYGPEAPLALLFIGDIQKVVSTRSGADWETKITAGDGQKDLTKNIAPVTFKAGTTSKEQLTHILGNEMKETAVGFVTDIVGSKKSKRGKTVEGRAGDVVAKIAGDADAEFSIQDGEAQITEPDLDTGEEAVLITPGSGLIGSPAFVSREVRVKGKDGKPVKGKDGKAIKQKVDGIEFKCLINPGLKPGRAVHVISEHFDGFYKVNKVKFEGENRGTSWYANCECTPLAAK